jgi:hypothetical protein
MYVDIGRDYAYASAGVAMMLQAWEPIGVRVPAALIYRAINYR